MKLRWLFLLIFAAGLAISAAYGLGAGADSSGWLAATLMAVAGLAWTWWGEPETAAEAVLALPPVEREMEKEAKMAGTEDAAVLNEIREKLEQAAESTRAGADGEGPARMSSADAMAARAAARLAGLPAGGPLGARVEEFFLRAPVPMVVLNREGKVERMNEAAEQVTEFAAAEVGSLAYWDVFLEEGSRERAEQDFRFAMLERAAPPRREEWKTRTGAVAAFDWVRTIVKDDYGQAEGILAVALPVARAASPAVNLTALADQLTTVNGYSEFLLTSVAAGDPIRGDLEAIHRAGVAATESLRAA